MSPTALIVHAHPEPQSFGSAQMREARAALTGRGYAVEVLDLYATGWNAVLASSDFPSATGYFKPQAEQQRAAADGTLPADVREHLAALHRADLLVLSFPLWWFSVPAVLKGWIDRVFVMGSVFGGEHGIFGQGALTGRRAVLLISTGGAQADFGPGREYGDLDRLLFHIHHGMLAFVGYDVLRPVVTHAPARQTETVRRAALADVHQQFSTLEQRLPVDLMRGDSMLTAESAPRGD
ncbi:NAD(P)H-dependent oxidoreductase [Kineosporia sp. J2-2]|uniref:NAD(P)H-dependent oxidoreductase n=1 Tax=Kineosporia corallincola TaxID=2835133 RepID=A0ABS5TLQ9_9ACTN|nr:NAD(P)H-dependent oxidoreductase [Kineosporia corallincola]MBT0772026.1 NAD(P)H-dependent oxidoreductase [Kineosporia corallincola]